MKYRGFLIGIVLATVALAAVILLRGGWSESGVSGGELRIVSVSPSVTEMLFALDLEDCVVGVSDRCDWPAEAKNIEHVGGFGTANIEKLLALRPSLVIGTGFQCADAAGVLRKAGIEVLDLKIRNFQEMFEAMRKIAASAGKPGRAEEAVGAMQAELKAIAARFEGVELCRRPKVFVEIWGSPITTVGRTSFIDEVIRRAGGINIAGGINQAYPRINPEKVIEWNPDVIILCYMGTHENSASQLAGRIGWADISAVRERRIINDICSDLILRPGPRLVEGVKILAERFYNTE